MGKSIVVELVVAIAINGTQIWSSSVRMFLDLYSMAERRDLMPALEKKRIKRGQRFQARCDMTIYSNHFVDGSCPCLNRRNIPIPRLIKRGGGNLIGLQPGAILKAKFSLRVKFSLRAKILFKIESKIFLYFRYNLVLVCISPLRACSDGSVNQYHDLYTYIATCLIRLLSRMPSANAE